MTSQQESIVDLLKHYGKLPLVDIEKKLQLGTQSVISQISAINARTSKTGTGIFIHRTGKKGNSSYEIQDESTDKTTIFKTMGRHGKSTIKHIRSYRSVGEIAMVETLEREARAQIAHQLAADKEALAQQIANAIR